MASLTFTKRWRRYGRRCGVHMSRGLKSGRGEKITNEPSIFKSACRSYVRAAYKFTKQDTCAEIVRSDLISEAMAWV
jgi:hypothetical protein